MLTRYALVNRKYNHLKLYIYFKYISDGYVFYNNENIKAWATDIGMSERWIKSTLKWLIKHKWITVNSKRKCYRIISYKELCSKLNIQPHSSAIYELDDFNNFKNYCCAVVITYYIKTKSLIDKKNQSESILADSNMNWHFYTKDFREMPISYLAKCLGVSNSTANNFKKSALQLKLISVKKNHPFIIHNGQRLSIEHLKYYKSAFPNIAGRIRTNGKYLRIVESDLIKSEVLIKRKRYKYYEKK